MLFKQALMIIICGFFALGAADSCTGNRLGVGPEFTRAFSMVGRIITSIAGMACLSPVIAALLRPAVETALALIGADPAMFAGVLLAPDAGGYAIATEMAVNPLVGLWSGTVVAAHIGGALSFNIPMCIGMLDKKHHRSFALGALSGLIVCPGGCVLGGLLSGLAPGVILVNLVPVLIVSAIAAGGLILIPEKFLRGFVVFGKLLGLLVMFGLVMAGIERLTGYALIRGMRPIGDGFLIAGTVGLTMAGVLCMTKLITRALKRPLAVLSAKTGMNELSLINSFNSLTTVIAGTVLYDQMDPKGRVVFASLVMAAGNTFGAHLGFIGTTAPELLMPTTVSKLFSGVLAIFVALLLYRRLGAPEARAA